MSQRFGRYELLRPLGRGGMAEVFLARYLGPEGFEKRLVIKRILPRLSDDQRLLRMFFEEARTHVSLSHGNLVSVFDFGRVENDYFIAMEHVRGADLNLLLAACRTAGAPLPAALVAYIGMELCRGLAYVHRQGFVHRDVSPRNVLISVDGEVKLSDFGLVLNAARDEAVGVRGTLAYAAPELARGDKVDARGDLYSLGCVLAEASVVVDGPLAGVVARARQPVPGDRFASADEMLVALEKEAQSVGMGREAVVRELATRMAALVPASEPEAVPVGEGAEATAATDKATYYRGNESAAFVDEVLGTKARTGRTWAVVAALVVAMAAGIGGMAWRSRAKVQQTAVAPVPAPVPVQPIVVAPATPTPTPTRTPTPTPTRTPRKHVAVVGSGTIKIQCSPWCIPFVDGVQKGPDRKNHTLSVAVGKHVVEVRRLDDRLQRDVKVDAGQSQALEFTFR